MEDFTFLKVILQKNVLRNFQIMVRDCTEWTNFWQSCKKLTRRQDEAAALKVYGISLVFLFCDVHTQTESYMKGISRLFANFLSCDMHQILLKSANIWPRNHKNRKGELVLRHSVDASSIASVEIIPSAWEDCGHSYVRPIHRHFVSIIYNVLRYTGPTRSNRRGKYAVVDAQLSWVIAQSRERMKQLQVLERSPFRVSPLADSAALLWLIKLSKKETKWALVNPRI